MKLYKTDACYETWAQKGLHGPERIYFGPKWFTWAQKVFTWVQKGFLGPKMFCLGPNGFTWAQLGPKKVVPESCQMKNTFLNILLRHDFAQFSLG